MKSRWHVSLLLLACMLALLSACGTATPTAPPVPPPPATTAPAAPTNTIAAVAAPTDTTAPAAPTNTTAAMAAPTNTPGPVTLGTGSVKIVWWHISTAPEARANWEKLANTYVKDHPNVSIEITVLENQAFKDKLATAMQS